VRYFSKLELRYACSRQEKYAKYANFQGCVYCLILNYHGSLLCCLKQPSHYIKLILFCQELFKVFSDYLKFVLLFSNNSDIISSIQYLVKNNFNYF